MQWLSGNININVLWWGMHKHR